MAVEDDQTVWRTVFCKDPTLTHVTTYPDSGTTQKVVQNSEVGGIWPITGANRIDKSDNQAGVGANIVYTVPANKILYISSASLATYETADATSNCRMGIRNDVDVLVSWLIYVYFTLAGQLVVPMNYSPAIEAAELYDVFVESSHANIGCRGLIHGWLEDA